MTGHSGITDSARAASASNPCLPASSSKPNSATAPCAAKNSAPCASTTISGKKVETGNLNFPFSIHPSYFIFLFALRQLRTNLQLSCLLAVGLYPISPCLSGVLSCLEKEPTESCPDDSKVGAPLHDERIHSSLSGNRDYRGSFSDYSKMSCIVGNLRAGRNDCYD